MASTIKQKVYCDRLGEVVVSEAGQIECPKCRGVCNWSNEMKMFNCTRCGRGWEKVPAHVTTEREAEQWLIDQCDKCGCGSPATHSHYGHPCCGGSMCCSKANV